MKRMIVWLLLIPLYLTPLRGLAEREPLFNAYDEETGKMGYIDKTGQWVIPPQFDGAYGFRGDYAVVEMAPVEDDEPDRWGRRLAREGIIDREGNWALPPEYWTDAGYGGWYYGGKDTGIWIIWSRDDVYQDVDENENDILVESLDGFFDIPTGFFSGLKWTYVDPILDSRLIPVADESQRIGYADRTTGELVIPCLYYAAWPGDFSEGVVVTALLDENFDPSEFFMMDETGAVIPLPDGLMVEEGYSASEGLMRVRDRETGLVGFVDLRGKLMIPPQFAWAENFKQGYSAVRFPEGDWGYIEREGSVIHRGIAYDGGFWGPDRDNGVYTLQTGKDEWSAFAITGDLLFSIQRENLVKLYSSYDDGLFWFAVDPSGKAYYWSQERKFGLVDKTGRVLWEAVWDMPPEEWGDFSEGLSPVCKDIDGQMKWGYIDERGELPLPLIYDAASSFENGLAFVYIGDRCGYIDHDGHFVFSWTDTED